MPIENVGRHVSPSPGSSCDYTIWWVTISDFRLNASGRKLQILLFVQQQQRSDWVGTGYRVDQQLHLRRTPDEGALELGYSQCAFLRSPEQFAKTETRSLHVVRSSVDVVDLLSHNAARER